VVSSKPCVNVSPYSTATITKSPKTSSTGTDPIQQLINQVTSQHIDTSKNALTNLDKMLLRSDVWHTISMGFFLVHVYNYCMLFRLEQSF